jgi:hypothetical protein
VKAAVENSTRPHPYASGDFSRASRCSMIIVALPYGFL